jgi:hypothetical protein
MKRFARILSTLTLCLAGASGLQARAQEPQVAVEPLTGQEALVPGLSGGRFLQPIKLRDCWYFISAETLPRSTISSLTVRRLPTHHCTAASRVLAYTYNHANDTLRATTKGDALVIAFSVRTTRQPYQGILQLFNVSPDTLENLRPTHNELLATGGLSVSRLAFEGQALVVEGTKVGTLVGETGSGDSYLARFERFLDSDTPPALVTHTEPPATEPSEQLADGAYVPPADGRYLLPFQVKDCWYFPFATALGRGFGLYQLHVTRLAANGCEGLTVSLDRTYDPRTLLVATKGASALVVAWSVKEAPPFINSPTSIRLYHLSPETLVNLRTTHDRLTSSTRTDRTLQASRLDFDGHRLIVEGIKASPLLTDPPESGEGSHFTATFEHFLAGEAPPSVLAW